MYEGERKKNQEIGERIEKGKRDISNISVHGVHKV